MAYNRQDKLYLKAKREGLRSRAVYKLREIDKTHRLLGRGLKVLDVGCAPGGWLEEAAEAVGPKGRVAGLDLLSCPPPGRPWAKVLLADASHPETAGKVLNILGGPADLVLSDAAPNLSGIRERDAAAVAELVRVVAGLAAEVLRPGGNLVMKTFLGEDPAAAEGEVRPFYKSLKRVRLSSTRKSSSELYLVLKGFRPGGQGAGPRSSESAAAKLSWTPEV